MADNAAVERSSTPADRELIGRRDTQAHLCLVPRSGAVGDAFTCGCGRRYRLLWDEEADDSAGADA